MAGDNISIRCGSWKITVLGVFAFLLTLVVILKSSQFSSPTIPRALISSFDTEMFVFPDAPVLRLNTSAGENAMNGSCSQTLPEQKYFHAYCDYYQPVIQPPSICTPNTELVIGIITSGNNFETRKVFRQTILSDLLPNVAYFFLLAKSNDAKIISAVAAEASQYNDVVVANFVDSYENLTLKSAFLLKYSSTVCPTADYTFKLDDDVFCNIPLVQQELAKHGQPFRKIYGRIFDKTIPIHDLNSKWHVDHYFEKYYPRYVSGTGYVITQDLLPLLYAQAMAEPFIRIEDAFITGICVRNLNLKVQHIEISSFRYNPPVHLDQINPKLISTIHQVTPEQIIALWKKLQS